MKKYLFVIVALCCMCFTSCKENFSNGERVGTVTKFSKAGVIWDSWDGHLNITQTGMNSAGEPFSFSLDNDRSDQDSIIRELINAQRYGWKIKIKYHQVWGFKNIFSNRGESDYFVDGIEILDKNFAHPLEDVGQSGQKAIKGLLGSKENPIHIVIDNK